MKNTKSGTYFGNILRRYFVIAATVFIIAGMLLCHTVQTERQLQAEPYTAQAPYVAGIQDGRVAIYLSGQQEPALITDIIVDVLPQADQIALQNRIMLSSEEALARLLEDYGS